MKVFESAENYLEAILMIREEKGEVRSIDIANHLGFSKPSVSVAMKNLRNKGLITMDQDGYILLTEDGFRIASDIYEKHKVLTALFEYLGVDSETARNDACEVEHHLSPVTFEKIKECYTNVISDACDKV